MERHRAVTMSSANKRERKEKSVGFEMACTPTEKLLNVFQDDCTCPNYSNQIFTEIKHSYNYQYHQHPAIN